MVDLLDRELISLLEQDACQTSQKLAEQLSVSPSTVRRRMQELLKGGIIRIVAIPEPKQVGFPLIAVVAFRVLHEKASALIKKLGSRKEVKCLYATSGQFDVIALMWFASTEHLFQFMQEDVGQLDGVTATETFICLHTEKNF